MKMISVGAIVISISEANGINFFVIQLNWHLSCHSPFTLLWNSILNESKMNAQINMWWMNTNEQKCTLYSLYPLSTSTIWNTDTWNARDEDKIDIKKVYFDLIDATWNEENEKNDKNDWLLKRWKIHFLPPICSSFRVGEANHRDKVLSTHNVQFISTILFVMFKIKNISSILGFCIRG